ncbi:GAF domain-containing protein [bacterium]|nr:GAF domain-containing protein [bacterium]
MGSIRIDEMKWRSITYLIIWIAVWIPGLPIFNVLVPLTLSERDASRVTGIESFEFDFTNPMRAGCIRFTAIRYSSPAAGQELMPGDQIIVPPLSVPIDSTDERAVRFGFYRQLENILYPLTPTANMILRGDSSKGILLKFHTPSLSETGPLFLRPRWIGGAILMMFSLFLIWLKPKESVSQLFFFANLLAYLSLTLGTLDAFVYPYDVIVLKTIVGNGFMLLCAIVFFHILLIFPKNKIGKRKQWIPVMYVLGFLVILGYGFAHALIKYVTLSYLILAFLAFALFVGGLVLIILTYREMPLRHERNRLKWLLFGMVYGFTPALLFHMLPTFLQKGLVYNEFLSTISDYSFLFLVFIPFGMFVSIARYHIWNVDVVLKKSVVFTILSIMLVVLYIVVVSASSLIFGSSFTVVDPGLIMVTILLAALFNPLKNRIQAILDNLFFRKAYDYKTNILEFARSATSTISLYELIEILTHQVVKLMNISRIAIYLLDNDHEFYRLIDSRITTDFSVTESDGLQHLNIPLKIECNDAFIQWLKQHDWYDSETQKFHTVLPALDALQKEQFILGIPFRNKNRLIGFMMLGSKLSELEYDQDDKNLLITFSNQFAVTMDNALAYRRIHEMNENLEQKIKERTTELEKTLSELRQTQAQLIQKEKIASLGEMVAGLVHEINNPLSFIKGNLELFRHHYERTEDKIKLIEEFEMTLQSSLNGVERINSLIIELKNFSRLDESEIKEVDIHEGIDSVLSVFLDQYAGALKIVKQYHATGLVNCYPREINQAVMEILVNAAEAIFHKSTNGTIKITTHNIKGATDRPGIQIRIDDDGIGIEAAIRDKIFNPFFTTKDIGKGAGLGLSVAYGVVQRHHGRLYFHSEKEIGTSFFIEIPMNVEREE